MVTANLTGGLLVRVADRLVRAVAPGGSVIVSGVTFDEERGVTAAFEPHLRVIERMSEDEWVGLLLQRPDV